MPTSVTGYDTRATLLSIFWQVTLPCTSEKKWTFPCGNFLLYESRSDLEFAWRDQGSLKNHRIVGVLAKIQTEHLCVCVCVFVCLFVCLFVWLGGCECYGWKGLNDNRVKNMWDSWFILVLSHEWGSVWGHKEVNYFHRDLLKSWFSPATRSCCEQWDVSHRASKYWMPCW